MLKKRLALCALALLFLLSWIKMQLESRALQEQYRGISVRLEHGIPQETVRAAALADGSAGAVCAWSRGAALELQNSALASRASVRPVAVYGDMSLVCPMELLSGALPVSADGAGCVIDAQTAQALYRSLDVLGVRLALNGREYIVRAVARTPEPTVLYRDPDIPCENLELGEPDAAPVFLLRCGVSGGYTLVENGFYAALTQGLAKLPALILLLGLISPLIRAAWQRRTIFLQLVLLLAALFLGTMVLGRLLDLSWSIPPRLLPTRWSDFQFWPRLVSSQISAFKALAYLTPVPKDIHYLASLRAFLRGLLLSVSTLSLAIYKFKKAQ